MLIEKLGTLLWSPIPAAFNLEVPIWKFQGPESAIALGQIWRTLKESNLIEEEMQL